MTRRRAIAALLMLALFAVAGLIFRMVAMRERGDAPQAPPPLQVEVAQVALQAMPRQVEISGFLQPWRSVPLAMEETGRVASLEHEHGDPVEAGDLIVALDTSLIEAEIAQMEAGLAQAREESDLAQARLERAEALFAERSLSQDELDARRAEARVAEAAVALRQAQVERERVRLQRHRLRAPMSGTLEALTIERGSQVQPGATLGRLDDTSVLEAVLHVAPEVRETLRVGDAVDLWPHTRPEEVHTGRIQRLGEVADALTRKFEVEIRIQNTDRRLLGGEPIVARLTTGPPREALLLRQEWVAARSGIDGVFRLVSATEASSQVEFVPVDAEPIWLAPGMVEIQSGLAPGDWVACERLAELRHLMPVAPLRTTAAGG